MHDIRRRPPIYVTRPVLPPLEEFIPYLEKIWDNKWLTNGAEFHQRFEQELAVYLGVKHLALVTNGTLGGSKSGLALRSCNVSPNGCTRMV